MVLHWRPPDVHIFDTDPSLITTGNAYITPFLTVISVHISRPLPYAFEQRPCVLVQDKEE